MHQPLVSPSTWKYGLGLAVWGVAVLGTLQIHRIPGYWGHAICGPWGCGPPAQALVAYHGFWLMLFVPPAIAFQGQLSIERLRKVGIALTVLGLVAFVGIVCWEAVDWLLHASMHRKRYVVQRCLFVVVNLVDLPTLQLILTGMTCVVIARVRRRRDDGEPDEQPTPATDQPQEESAEMAESLS